MSNPLIRLEFGPDGFLKNAVGLRPYKSATPLGTRASHLVSAVNAFDIYAEASDRICWTSEEGLAILETLIQLYLAIRLHGARRAPTLPGLARMMSRPRKRKDFDLASSLFRLGTHPAEVLKALHIPVRIGEIIESR
jgi:hypothetical protein